MAYVYYDQNVNHNSEYQSEITTAEKVSAILKVISLFGFMVVLGIVLLVRQIGSGSLSNKSVTRKTLGRIEYVTPYENVLYENFGFVTEPKLTLPLKTLDGYRDTTFLLDSGAVVSALPLNAAHDTGVDLTKAKRITLQGFSGIPTFAYLDNIVVNIADKDFTFPAVFTESQKTTYILGRKGFFDDFTIEFNNEEQVVTITTKE